MTIIDTIVLKFFVTNLIVGKIESDEADHVIENLKKYPTDQKKKDARNQNQRAAKKKIENLPSRKYFWKRDGREFRDSFSLMCDSLL